MRLLDRSPFADLSLRTVASEAGVAAPSVYHHFSSANEMMKDVARECWQQLGDEMSAAAALAIADTPLVRLQDQMGAYVRYAMKTPSRYQLLFASHVAWDTEIDGPVRPAYRPVLTTIEQHAAQSGRLPASDAGSAAIVTISFAHGRVALAHLAPVRQGNLPHDVESFVRATVRRLFSMRQD